MITAKTIYLYSKREKLFKLGHLLLGLSFLINIYNFIDTPFLFVPILGIIGVGISFYYTFGPNTKLKPRIEINEDFILYKKDVFQKAVTYFWKDIASVRVSNLALTLRFKDKTVEYIYLPDDKENRLPIMEFASILAQKENLAIDDRRG
jgi:hypothetical protein